jgi:hypothetical protein
MDRNEIERKELLYVALGESISNWAETEALIAVVGAMLLGTTADKAGLVFYSIPSFYSWLTIIDELFIIDTQFAKMKPAWGEIAETLKKLNDTRVRLAHHSSKRPEGRGGVPALRPISIDARSKSKKYAPMEVDEIVNFIARLDPVYRKLSALILEMIPIYRASQPPSL